MKRIYQLGALVLILVLVLSGCSSTINTGEKENKGKPIVYTSFYPVYNIVSEVAGDTLDLRTFMPIGQDPHLWEPSPKNIKELSEADLLIVNGANMEKWTDQIQEALPDLKILNLAAGVNLITYKGAAALGDFQYMTSYDYKRDVYPIEFGHTHEDGMRIAFYRDDEGLSQNELVKVGREIMEDETGEFVNQWDTIEVEEKKVYKLEMGHEHGGINYQIPEEGKWIFYSDRISTNHLPYRLLDTNNEPLNEEVLRDSSTTGEDKITYDPHSWLSIRNAKRYLNDTEATLAGLYPQHARTYRRNTSRATKELTDLDFEYREKFKDLDFREFVVTHYAFAYTARDFDLVQYPLQGLTSTGTPSIKKIREAIDFARRNHVDTIFYEYGMEKKGADTIAQEVDGQASPLISMEYLSKELDKDGKGYTDFMRHNLENIYDALR